MRRMFFLKNPAGGIQPGFLVRTVCLVLLMTAGISAGWARKANVHILATGGTIAGTGASAAQTNYTAGQVEIGTLLEAVPQIGDLANVTGEQVVKIGSQDMNDEVWLALARRIGELLADPEVDGIVITHGTDTMEETAYFLHLTVGSEKPVVLVGAMRPSTSLSADGPLNLYNAVAVAADTASRNRGVLVAMNGKILGARGVVKMNTVDAETFQAPDGDLQGYVHNGKAVYLSRSTRKHAPETGFDLSGLRKLPKVGIVYSHSGVSEDVMEPFLKGGYLGIVHAGVGNGNIHENIFPALEKARKKGISVVRSSRVPTGPVTPDAEVDDDKYEFIASQGLNPQKARILLMLALTRTSDWREIRRYFDTY